MKIEEFIKTKSFLQSSRWQALQEFLGAKTKVLGSVFWVKKPLFLNRYYYYAPRGEFSVSDLERAIKELSSEAIFLRFEPLSGEVLKKIKTRKTIPLQPPKTLILDLSLPLEKLWAQMHQKTRYNMRLAEKKGVEIVEGRKEETEEFIKLIQLTSKRDSFSLHSENYYRRLIAFDPEFIKLYFAKYEGRYLAAGLFCFYDETLTYLHGASSNEFRNLMAPYLLHQKMISLAKEKGYHYYDFFGIDEKKWPGVTRFKKGFGGEEVEYPGTFDLVLDKKWYFIYSFLRKIRRSF